MEGEGQSAPGKTEAPLGGKSEAGKDDVRPLIVLYIKFSVDIRVFRQLSSVSPFSILSSSCDIRFLH